MPAVYPSGFRVHNLEKPLGVSTRSTKVASLWTVPGNLMMVVTELVGAGSEWRTLLAVNVSLRSIITLPIGESAHNFSYSHSYRRSAYSC